MALKILPHGRLQEWVAEEQGYFAAEGLEYTFLPEGDYGSRPGRSAPAPSRRSAPGAAAPTSAARATANSGYHPGRTGGPWLCRTLVLSLFRAVVVPSGFRTRVQPHR
jgi:hypothetical protein